jgi:hypothetical protein
LSSSEIYKGIGYSHPQIDSKKDIFSKKEARPSSYVPGYDAYKSDYGPISEPGKPYNTKQSEDGHESGPEDHYNNREESSEPIYDPNYAAQRGQPYTKIHYEDHDSQEEQTENHLDSRDPQNGQPVGERDDRSLMTSNQEDQMRPTPDFVPPLETIKDDSQEGASSYNPFRQNLLNREANNRTEEHSADSNVARSKKKKDGDSLIKGIKSKIPGGKLRDEDLERIERIFRNRKFDAKAFDLEDSDMDYY